MSNFKICAFAILLLFLSFTIYYFKLIAKGNELFEKGRYKDALKIYQKLERFKIFPSYIYLKKSIIYQNLCDYDESIKRLKLYLKFNPEDLDAKYKLAIGLYRQNQINGAIKILKKISEKEKSKSLYNALTIFLYEIDEIKESAKYNDAFPYSGLEIKKLLLEELKLEKNFSTLETENFKIRYTELEKNSAYEIAENLEKIYKRTNNFFINCDYKTVVKILNNTDFTKITGSKYAVAAAVNNKIFIRSPRFLPINKNLEKIIVHEYIHLLVYRLTRGNCPKWLDEGLASFFSKGNLDKEDFKRLNKYINIITLNNLDYIFDKSSRDEIKIGYIASQSIVNFIIDKFGVKKVIEILKNLSCGRNIEDAILESLGISKKELETKWKKYIDGKFI